MKITTENVIHIGGVGFFRKGNTLKGLQEYIQIDGVEYFVALDNEKHDVIAKIFETDCESEELNIILTSPGLFDKMKESKKATS